MPTFYQSKEIIGLVQFGNTILLYDQKEENQKYYMDNMRQLEDIKTRDRIPTTILTILPDGLSQNTRVKEGYLDI